LNTVNEGAAVKPTTDDLSLSPTLSADNVGNRDTWSMSIGRQNNVKMTADNTVGQQ